MKAVALISGGIDSPVAVYLMARQGVEVIPLHMDNRDDDNTQVMVRARDIIARIAEVVNRGEGEGGIHEAYQIPHGTLYQPAIAEAAIPRYQCVLCKRAMLRTAQALCHRVGASAIVTGESLGQVASQTLPNLMVEDSAVSVPVIRPLIGLDKTEIIDIARAIGTFDMSTDDPGECAFVPSKPATGAGLDDVLEAEAPLDLDALLEKTMEGLVRIEI